MKFFIDTANIDDIKEALAIGMCDGVTTNPSLVAKEGKEFEPTVKEIIKTVPGPVSVEVTALDAEGMVSEAEKFAKWGDNVVIKVPLTTEGLKAIKTLSGKNIKTNATLIFSVNQAIMAAKAGATYVSPFIGRLDDIGQCGMALIEDVVQVFNNYGYKTEVIVASIRHPLHVVEAAKIGAHISTIPPAVIQKMAKHPLTDIGIERFLADWAKAKK